MKNNVPLVFDEEIRKILQEPAPIHGKYWPDMRKTMIEKECNLLEKLALKLPFTDYIDIVVDRKEEKEEGYAYLVYGNKVKKAKRFEKKPIILRESQDDFEAVYNKVDGDNQ